MKALHPNAAAALNPTADTISLDSPPKTPPGSGPSWVQQHVSFSVTEKELKGTLRMTVTDGLGEKEGIFSRAEGKNGSISGESLLRLRTLTQRVLEISSIGNLLSAEYVEQLAIDWSFDGSETRPPFAEFLMRRAEQDVSQHQIWLPTAYLEVEENFGFGGPEIIVIPRTFFDDAERELVTEKPEHAETAIPVVQKWRKNFQGNAAVAIQIEGEPRYAKNKARIIAQDVIGLLRFFHFASFSPRHFCPSALFGAEFMPQASSFTIDGTGHFSEYHSAILHKAQPWRISRAELAEMKQGLLPTITTLVPSHGISEFALRVKSSILTYSRGMTFPDMSDRLVYSLSALEGLFLRNASEIIQQNLSERIAFVRVKGVDDRLRVVASCKKIYGARSKYIHHRESATVPDSDLELFFIMARRALETALRNTQKFQKTDAFLDQIDRMKFS
jgi:hypothetical protein